MPYKAKAPAGETFILEETDRYYGLEEGEEPTFVVIREAVESENAQRNSLFAEIRRVIDTENRSRITFEQTISDSQLYTMEIRLTLADSNITDEHGKPLFRFRQEGSKRVVDMSATEFATALGKLPSRVVAEIHKKVLQKNPDWSPGGN